jgi:hypothetical protein
MLQLSWTPACAGVTEGAHMPFIVSGALLCTSFLRQDLDHPLQRTLGLLPDLFGHFDLELQAG